MSSLKELSEQRISETIKEYIATIITPELVYKQLNNIEDDALIIGVLIKAQFLAYQDISSSPLLSQVTQLFNALSGKDELITLYEAKEYIKKAIEKKYMTQE